MLQRFHGGSSFDIEYIRTLALPMPYQCISVRYVFFGMYFTTRASRSTEYLPLIWRNNIEMKFALEEPKQVL